MDPDKKLKKSRDQKYCLSWKTTHPDGDSYQGIITHITDDLVAFNKVDDFEFDGTIVIPKQNLLAARDGRFERCTNEIIRENGQFKRFRSQKWLGKCTSLPEVFSAFKERDIWPAI